MSPEDQHTLPTRRDLERLAVWADLHRVDTLGRAELSRRLEAAAGVSLLEHEAVHRLVITPGRRLTMFELADRLLVSRSGATRLVDRLEARGWIARRTAPADRRVVYAELTPAGTAAFERSRAVFASAFEEQFAGRLEDEDIVALRRVLTRLLAGSDDAQGGERRRQRGDGTREPS